MPSERCPYRPAVVLRSLLLLLLLLCAKPALAYLPEEELQEQRGNRPASPVEDCLALCPRLEAEQGEAEDAAGTEVDCGVGCRIDHCSDGCTIWEQALNSSCQNVCNETQRTLSIKEIYCTIGCQTATRQHYQELKVNIGVPPTPYLVDDSLAAASLTLQWENSNLKQYASKILYFVQWKYENGDGNWQYCEKQSWNGNNQLSLYNLQPYTRYRFRLAILLKFIVGNDEPLVSKPSLSILTFPSGPPTSAPLNLRASAIDHSRIYVNWKAGVFTNGPLLSYILRLQQEGLETFQLKDIPISQDTFMFQKLEANSNYSVSVTMRNADGEGPSAYAFIRTLLEPEANSSEKPSLIISTEYTIMRQSADVLVQTSLLYETTSQIRDTAILASDSQLFVCDSDDRLYRVAINANLKPILMLQPSSTDLRPWMMSVDWLNRQLYVAGTNESSRLWEISRYGFDDGNWTKLNARPSGKLIRMEVDPYNGYLFWTTGDGLYRVDLADLEKEVEIKPEEIVRKQSLGTFMVDYKNKRLLVVFQTENTIKSVSLDGQIVVNIRGNNKKSKFVNVTSISMMNGLFYWTNRQEILTESYEPTNYRYHINVLLNSRPNENFVSVYVLSEDSQPIPVATAPPTDLQVLALANSAKVSWRAPGPLAGQGVWAWVDWSYALHVEDDASGEAIQERGIRGEGTRLTIDELRDNSLYSVKVAACTAAGDGPWTKELKVQTLRKDLNVSILWALNDTLLQSDLIGENVKAVVNLTSLDEENVFITTDVHSYKEMLFIIGSNSKVYLYNTTSKKLNSLKHIQSVSSIAVEWITEKIYWADPNRRIILRSYLDGSHEEPVALVAGEAVRRLQLDPLEARLYWSTSRDVEVARLNGEDGRSYRRDNDGDGFDGRHVAGLALDLENRYVYWATGDYEGDHVMYRAPTAELQPMDHEIVAEMVSKMQRIVGSSLFYVSNRFVYLSSYDTVLTTDAHGKYTAALGNITDSGNYSTIALRISAPQPDPNIPRILVSPQPINVSSIGVVGTWRDFNVTWQPVDNTNYGLIFYKVAFTDYINVDTDPVTTSNITVSYANADRLLPYSLIEVSVQAYTYWASAPKVSRVLRSPQSVPSQPVNPKVFVESYKDPLIEQIDYFVIFRWNLPEFVNGPVLGFMVRCWLIIDNIELPLCDSINVPSVSKLEYKVHNLQANTTYYFQVCAYAEVGAGPYTDPISTSTENENPVPQLLVATMEDVKKIDLDERSNLTITRHIAVEVAQLAAEGKIYWINEMQELVTANVDGKNITKILTLNNTALSLCTDWISRNVFWTESSYEDSGISHIMKLDLTVWEAGVLKYSRILSRNRRIVNLDIAPLTGNLFWMELSTSNLGFVMQSDLLGYNIQPFFNHTEDCSCPFRPTIQPVFTIDNSDSQNPVLYWISAEGDLHIADIEGCICNIVLQANNERGLPPTSLTTDKSHIYWSNMDTGKIHFTDKIVSYEDVVIKEYSVTDTRSIRAIGKSLQPYPDTDCLILQQAIYRVQFISKTPSSINVKLPEPVAYLGCEKYSLPATLYIIDIAECLKTDDKNNGDGCDSSDKIRFETYSKEFEAKNLKPFTEYRFKLLLLNYYGDQDSASTNQYTPGIILKTAAGIPSKPNNVEVKSLTPTLAIVNWKPSRNLNAEFVHYKVFWRYVKPIDGIALEGEKTVKEGEMSTFLQPLLPNQDYFVYVRVYPENFTDVYNQSDEKLLKTLQEPNNLTLIGVTSETLNVSWLLMKDVIANYTLEFAMSDLENWQSVYKYTLEENRVTFHADNLKANEFYKFRLILKYRNHTEDFVWPNDGRFVFQTLEDIPTTPGTPMLVNLHNSNYQLFWDPAVTFSSQTLMYFLEGTVISPSNDPTVAYSFTNKWNTFYNGTENQWDIQYDMHQKYLFRVRAKNNYGYGNWSNLSAVIDLTDMARAMVIAQEHLGLILGLSVPAITIVLLCFWYFLCPFNKKSKEDQKKVPIKSKPYVELATVSEIPRGNFVESNSLYVSAVESNSDDTLLPKIQRDQISLARFLGRGAFGEVFQGVVKDLDGPGSRTPIAIKTLRKGASGQEKSEFLQEAKLMSHFQHKHVLRLLGVCLDTDPPLLLLELMSGGDLLSYLRISRSTKPMDPGALRLQDLLSMCEDVARGCQYLEELHFVHRDLACRNCLVSARERENRVVKIGDFGLARDIYKNDYYRKEGEGLLPVRWMAPESLVDGVFTSQSDVWAFGVLMWEITSLGQQPYQARTNREVLHHVRAGGRLPKPLNCPPRLHQLMLRCWSAMDARPSFKLCLEHIVGLRNCTEDCTLSPVNPGHFFVQGNVYKSNHFKGNLNIHSLLQESDSSKPAIGPKYSWLLDDALEVNEFKDPRAAYEVPKSIPVEVENLCQNQRRYTEVCSSDYNNEKEEDEGQEKENTGYSESNSSSTKCDDQEDNPRWNRTSVASLNVLEKRLDKLNLSEKRSSTTSLGDKVKAADGMKQSGSYARLVGNGELVSSLSDWRRVKKIAKDERERLSTERNNSEEIKSNTFGTISYSMVTFPQTTSGQRYTDNGESNKAAQPKLHRTRSNLQTSKANIPLVINSALLNLLRQESEIEDESSGDPAYANIDPENIDVTDL